MANHELEAQHLLVDAAGLSLEAPTPVKQDDPLDRLACDLGMCIEGFDEQDYIQESFNEGDDDQPCTVPGSLIVTDRGFQKIKQVLIEHGVNLKT